MYSWDFHDFSFLFLNGLLVFKEKKKEDRAKRKKKKGRKKKGRKNGAKKKFFFFLFPHFFCLDLKRKQSIHLYHFALGKKITMNLIMKFLLMFDAHNVSCFSFLWIDCSLKQNLKDGWNKKITPEKNSETKKKKNEITRSRNLVRNPEVENSYK